MNYLDARDRKAPTKPALTRPGWPLVNRAGRPFHETAPAVLAGRAHIAQLAEADGELTFAREVRCGLWDHRRDVAAAIAAHEGPAK